MRSEQHWERAISQHNEIIAKLDAETVVCLSCGCLASECTSSLHRMAEAHQAIGNQARQSKEVNA